GQTSLFSETRVFALPSDGTYQVVVDGAADAAGAYRLGFSEIEDPALVTLQAVTELTPTISVLGDRQFFRFAATAEDVRNVVLDHPSGGLVTQAFLRRPGTQPFYQRSPITSTQTSTATRLGETRPLVLPTDGDYVVEVGTYAVNGGVRTTHTGDYRVRLFAPTPIALSRDTERTSTLGAWAFDVYRFSGQAGELFNVATLGEGVSGGVTAQVYGPGGQFVRQSGQTSLFSETRVFALPSDGTYQVVVDAVTDAAGAYRLGFSEIGDPIAATAGTPITADISVLGDRQFFRYERTVGQTVQVTLDHPSGGLVAQTFVRRPGSQPFYQRSVLTSTQTTTTTRSATSFAATAQEAGAHVIEVGTYAVGGGNRSNHAGPYRLRF
ncbi:MAG: hypothetical protein AAFP18_02645, partial [Bacteroidota bacterium]